jgi:hypothetical protein
LSGRWCWTGRAPGGDGAPRWRGAWPLLASLALVALVIAEPAFALTNGDFSDALNGWQTRGPVTAPAGELILTDDGPSASAAWQTVATQASRSVLQFELLGALSDFTPADPFGFPDAFAASIYLFDDAGSFDPAASAFDSAVSVLSLDWTGPFDVNALVTPSARGGGWLHVAIEFDSPYAFIAPAFELFELGFVGGDSEVRIDGVSLAPVPEPGTAALLALGLLALARRARERARP